MNIEKGFSIEKMKKPLAEEETETKNLESLNNLKRDLENKLDEINSEIEISKYESKKTRSVMQEGGWDKNDDFKEHYDSTISEVAGNLNELRNKKNKIKDDLEKINSEIESINNKTVSNHSEEINQSV